MKFFWIPGTKMLMSALMPSVCSSEAQNRCIWCSLQVWVWATAAIWMAVILKCFSADHRLYIYIALLKGNLQYLWCYGSVASLPIDHQANLQLWPLTRAHTASLSSCSQPARKHTGRETVYRERKQVSHQKEQRQRVIGSIERRFFSPVTQGRFQWKAVAVYRSALWDGYCEAKDGRRQRCRGIHATRGTQTENSIRLVFEENKRKRTVTNKSQRPRAAQAFLSADQPFHQPWPEKRALNKT